MGSDDLFHKRKSRNLAGLKRRKESRPPYAKVLIVCEGEKTEPLYFKDLRNYYKLSSANIEVTGDCGSAPISVYEYAIERYREEERTGDPFDKVYCVFDKDQHDSYQAVMERIGSTEPADVFIAINSVPCFEYWLILHFNYTTKPYHPLQGNSVGHQVLNDLRQLMPDYQKGQQNVFSRLVEGLEFAKENSKRALIAAHDSHTDNPSTKAHDLVEFLQNIKE